MSGGHVRFAPLALFLLLLVLPVACGGPEATATTYPEPEQAETSPVPSPTPAIVPPGPVETISRLPTGADDFLVGIGPIPDRDDPNILEWHVYRGSGGRWNRQNWPRDARPCGFLPSPTYAEDRTVFGLPFSYAFIGRGQPWGLVRSTDGGFKWEQALEGFADPYVISIALSSNYAQDGGVIYAVTWYQGLHVSRDGGDSWEPMSLPGVLQAGGGPNPYDVTLGMAPDDDAGDFILVSAAGQMFSSHVRGGVNLEPWSVISTTVLPIAGMEEVYDLEESTLAANAVAFSPDFAADGTIYAYSGYAGLYRSPDRGQTWQETGLELPPPVPFISRVLLEAASADEVYLMYEMPEVEEGRQLFRTLDGGENWESLKLPVSELAPAFSSFALELTPQGDTRLHLGGSRGGVFTYSPADLSWETVHAYSR